MEKYDLTLVTGTGKSRKEIEISGEKVAKAVISLPVRLLAGVARVTSRMAAAMVDDTYEPWKKA